MHSFFNQVYNEGLGASIYLPIENLINKLNNKHLAKVLIIIWKAIYLLLLLLTASILFYISYPFK